MATIELRDVCKHLEQKNSPPSLINPFTSAVQIQEQMQAGMAQNGPTRPFSMEKLNLTIPDGKTMVILGPSGCGKSTLLRLIAGLMLPDSGDVLYDGVSMEGVPPGERQIGMVFQNYALYPHFSTQKNILSYFFFKKSTPEFDDLSREKYRKTSELLEIDIEHLQGRMPQNLSGGEKQRIALGRCITRDPKLFLLDEPFSNLDQPLREKYRIQLRSLLRHFNITTAYVTHDQQEALILAHIMAIMNVGSIEQVGKPQEIYNAPDNKHIAEFLNYHSDTPAINFFDGELFENALKESLIGVRSEDIKLCEHGAERSFPGVVIDVRHDPITSVTILNMTIYNTKCYARMPLNTNINTQAEVAVRFKKYHVFDKHTGLRTQTVQDD